MRRTRLVVLVLLTLFLAANGAGSATTGSVDTPVTEQCGSFEGSTSFSGYEEIEGRASYDPPHDDPYADTVSINLVNNSERLDITFSREAMGQIAPPFDVGAYPLSARPAMFDGVVDTVFANLGSYHNCDYDSCESIAGSVTIDAAWTQEIAGDTWHYLDGSFEFDVTPVPGKTHDGPLSAEGTFCAKGIEPTPVE